MSPLPSASHLAIDLGASSGRAVLGQLDGSRMQMREIHRFPTPLVIEGERLYWDLDAVWLELQEALRRAPNVRSLSVDSWGVDYVPLDAEMRPVRRAHCYRDPRTQGMEAEAERRVTASEQYAFTGVRGLSINTLYQVMADQTLTPDQYARTSCRLLVADYFNYRFCARPVAEASLASTTQLFDPRTRQWTTEFMRRMGLSPETWPLAVASGTRLGPMRLGEHPLGLDAQVEVIAGCSHDTACAVAAVPAEEGGDCWAYLSSGTWSLLGVELTDPMLTETARLAGFTNEVGLGGTIRLLKNMTGLWVLQECERAWRLAGETFDYDTLWAEARRAAPVEGFVDLNEGRFTARGDMPTRLRAYCREHGIQEPTSRGAVVRLILTSLAETYRACLRQLEGLLGRSIQVLHVVGGGSRNALLNQWTADACGCTVVAGPAEATALGNLLVQACAMGALPTGVSLREVAAQSCQLHVYEPQAEA